MGNLDAFALGKEKRDRFCHRGIPRSTMPSGKPTSAVVDARGPLCWSTHGAA